MEKTAGLFSGQGSQYVGMGRELYDNHLVARKVFDLAKEVIGIDLIELGFTATEEEIAGTLISQPAIFATSVAAWEASREHVGELSAVVGHSLGEFAALYVAGAYSLEDGLRIIKARAKAMDEAAKTAKGAMVAIINSDEKTIEKVCQETAGLVVAVNYNTPSQTVISGEEEAVLAAANTLKEMGARVVRLGVSSGFHTTLMEAAAKQFEAEIAGINFRETTVPFYSNVTGGLLRIKNYPSYFREHMVSPVRFAEEVNAFVANGVTKAIEFGPGKTVATLAKKNNKALKVHNVQDQATFIELFSFLED